MCFRAARQGCPPTQALACHHACTRLTVHPPSPLLTSGSMFGRHIDSHIPYNDSGAVPC